MTRKKTQRLWWGTAIMALLVIHGSFLFTYYVPESKKLSGDEVYYTRIAQVIAHDGTPQLNFLWPPLYGIMLGALFHLAGIHPLYAQTIQLLCLFGLGWIWYRMTLCITTHRSIAYGVGFLILINPELVAFTHHLRPEILHLLFFSAALFFLIRFPHKTEYWALAGLFLGLALLTKSILSYFIPIFLFVALYHSSESLQMKFRYLGALLAVMMFTVLPTMAKNYGEEGVLTIADSSTVNAWIGLQEVATADYQEDLSSTIVPEFAATKGTFAEKKHLYQKKIMTLIRNQGILPTLWKQLSKQYFRLLDVESFFTTQLPGGPRPGYSLNIWWLNFLLRAYTYFVYSALLASAVIGLCVTRFKRERWLQAFVLFILYNLIVFLILHATTRYRLQLMPILILFSAIGVVWLSQMWKGVAGGVLYRTMTPARIAVTSFLILGIEGIAWHNVLFDSGALGSL